MPDDPLPPIDDDAVRQALKAPAERPFFYVLAPNGTDAGVLLMGRRKFSSKVANAAKKHAEATLVLTGVCHGEGDTLVFEYPKPPQPSWAKVAKTLIKKATNLKPGTEFRQGRGDDEVLDPQDDDPVLQGGSQHDEPPPQHDEPSPQRDEPPPQTPVGDVDKEAFDRRMKLLMPQLQKLKQDAPGDFEGLAPALNAMRELGRKGEFGKALLLVEKLEPHLSGEDAFKKAARLAMERVRQAQQAGVEVPGEVLEKIKASSGLAKTRDFHEASRTLEGVEDLLNEAGKSRLAELIKDFNESSTSLGNLLQPGLPAWIERLSAPLRSVRQRLVLASKGGPTTVPQFHQDLEDLKRALPELRLQREKYDAVNDFINDNGPRLERFENLKTSQQEHQEAVQRARRMYDEHTAMESFDGLDLEQTRRRLADVEQAFVAVERLSAARLLQMAGTEGAKLKDVRRQAVQMLEAEPWTMKSLAATQEGRELLDKLVTDLGGKASGKTDNAFVKEALNARYGAKFSGDLEASAGPRLYKVFGMVPDKHTLLNPRIKEVKRNKNYKTESSYGVGVDSEEGVGGDHIILNGVRTGGIKGWVVDTLASTDNVFTRGVSKYQTIEGEDKRVDAFEATTLHEIAHGVDENLSYMDQHGSKAEYGGWQQHQIADVADVIGDKEGFYSAFAPASKDVLKAYLVLALSKGFDPDKLKQSGQSAISVTAEPLLKDPGVASAEASRKTLAANGRNRVKVAWHTGKANRAIQLKGDAKALAQAAVELIIAGREAAEVVPQLLALKTDAKLDWSAMAKHEAVTRCKAIRLHGSESGLWEKGDGAAKFAVDGRVYQEAYPGKWNSYLSDGLKTRVTNYQFRSPAEWFAEAYSAYYLGKLPKGHPLTNWLNDQRRPG